MYAHKISARLSEPFGVEETRRCTKSGFEKKKITRFRELGNEQGNKST